jgi:serine/threonine protein kinase
LSASTDPALIPCLYLSRIFPFYSLSSQENGDLQKFLRAHHEIQVKGLTNMAADVSSGLTYLHSQKFVHGDLACRNCLVDKNLTVKISDFGCVERQGR